MTNRIKIALSEYPAPVRALAEMHLGDVETWEEVRLGVRQIHVSIWYPWDDCKVPPVESEHAHSLRAAGFRHTAADPCAANFYPSEHCWTWSSPMPSWPRPFRMLRERDESGVSGTGWIAEGVQFSNGKCALAWMGAVASVAVYDSLEALTKIHGHGGATKVVFLEAP